MKITLTGYMGSGKSTLAKALAKELGLTFIDLDLEIEKQAGFSISELIFNKGELYFRKSEREMLLQILKQSNFVLALGGGTPCYYNNMEEINRHSISIYLKMQLNDLVARLEENRSDRPLIAHLEGAKLKEFIAKHLFERASFYEQSIFSLKPTTLETNERIKEIKAFLL